MKRTLLASLMAMALAGCASPFDERWHDEHSRAGELPRWVTEEWNAGVSQPNAARRTHNSARSIAPSSLDDFIAIALERNPAVQAAEARWHAASERIIQARTLPEPELSYRIVVDQIDTDRDPIGHAVGITQMFPWFGTLERAADVQHAEARAAAQRYVQQQFAVVSAVRQAWAEYAYLHHAASVQREQIALLQQIESVVRSRFRTGEVGQRDLVRVEAELDRVANDLRDAEEMIPVAAARLNAATGRSADAPLPDSPRVPVQAFEVDADELIDRLAAMNPSLGELRERLAARRHARQLAEKRFYPDIMLGVEYGIDTSARMAGNERRAGVSDPGSDMLMGMIGLRLPIWRSSYEAGVREAMAEWGATLRELDDRRNTLEADLQLTIYAMRDAERRVELFGTRLRVRAEQVLGATQAAYRAGDANFTDLIEAQRELLEFELATRRAEADRFRAIARLEELVGVAAGVDHAQEDRP